MHVLIQREMKWNMGQTHHRQFNWDSKWSWSAEMMRRAQCLFSVAIKSALLACCCYSVSCQTHMAEKQQVVLEGTSSDIVWLCIRAMTFGPPIVTPFVRILLKWKLHWIVSCWYRPAASAEHIMWQHNLGNPVRGSRSCTTGSYQSERDLLPIYSSCGLGGGLISYSWGLQLIECWRSSGGHWATLGGCSWFIM